MGTEAKRKKREKTKGNDFMQLYRSADADGRLKLLMENYYILPKIIRWIETKIRFKIRAEKEYMHSRNRVEAGVRVTDLGLSNPTEEEALLNIVIDEAITTGEIDKGLLKGCEDTGEYIADIHLLQVIRMDYELLTEKIESLEDKECEWVKAYLLKEKQLKEISFDQKRSYAALRKKYFKIREGIRKELIECLELNCG